ncbi:hypothetical protein [Dictyobacter kobayashii]|uniref:DUF2127 domain-containing protein n=1 Tax=Dictyobacter kobayashii TaxID=2014872 RepID=A0A402ASX2_9CHLR|nr:hypothetical protein [Dictyobacter kobayashii]GCE22197.1 hypothetical protein KDK_59970 [Dictyobacter kobayashii]
MQSTTGILRRKRPLGIKILAMLLGIEGILACLLAFFTLIVSVTDPVAIFGVIIATAFGLVSLILAWALWELKPWALPVTIAIQIVNVAISVLNFILMLPKNTFSTLFINLLAPAIILCYLLANKRVRVALKR